MNTKTLLYQGPFKQGSHIQATEADLQAMLEHPLVMGAATGVSHGCSTLALVFNPVVTQYSDEKEDTDSGDTRSYSREDLEFYNHGAIGVQFSWNLHLQDYMTATYANTTSWYYHSFLLFGWNDHTACPGLPNSNWVHPMLNKYEKNISANAFAYRPCSGNIFEMLERYLPATADNKSRQWSQLPELVYTMLTNPAPEDWPFVEYSFTFDKLRISQ